MHQGKPLNSSVFLSAGLVFGLYLKAGLAQDYAHASSSYPVMETVWNYYTRQTCSPIYIIYKV